MLDAGYEQSPSPSIALLLLPKRSDGLLAPLKALLISAGSLKRLLFQSTSELMTELLRHEPGLPRRAEQARSPANIRPITVETQ